MLEESKGACGFDGYLKMNGAMSTDYTKMEQVPPPPTDHVDLINEKEKESVHRNDDTDSGHSSTYVPGTSPPDTGDDGYLIPKTGPDGGFVKKNGNKKNKSREFTQDYHEDRPPPTYSTVVEDSEIPV